MFGDDFLMEKLVLKGASAMELVYGITKRSSIDVDFSIEECFLPQHLIDVSNRIKSALEKTFAREGFSVFDFNFDELKRKSAEQFWGGYTAEFKIIEKGKVKKLEANLDKMRVQAEPIGKSGSANYRVEISKFEFCGKKTMRKLDDYTIYLYTPEMIAFEKLRAICQQMPEYAHRSNRTKTARARDFYDIYHLCERFNIKVQTEEAAELVKNIFAAKDVPLKLLFLIETQREFHRQDFASVQATVDPGENLKEFDFYFEYVAERVKELKAFGII
jgi:predicted nucleotidyltransferase component of viral defense system